MPHLILFVNSLFSYKYVYLSILSSVIKLTYVKQQVFLFLQEVYIETYLRLYLPLKQIFYY